jgi:hypothetical protein
MASYAVNPDAVARARQLIDSRQIVLDSDWGKVQPGAAEQNAFLESHSWEEYAQWHLGLTEATSDHTKARYAFVYGQCCIGGLVRMMERADGDGRLVR